MVVDAPNGDNDFEFHLRAPQGGERKGRGTQFISTFVNKVSEGLRDNQTFGFDCKDRGNTQPNGQSCLIASMVASARGMETTTAEFAPQVAKLFGNAERMGIVNQVGIDPTRTREIALLATEVGLVPEFKTYYPNDVSVAEIESLAESFVAALRSGSGIAVLIPASRHYVLVHGIGKDGFRVYDPLTGSDENRPLESIASNIGNIVNGDMMGEKYSGNGFIILNSQSKDDDFVVNKIV